MYQCSLKLIYTQFHTETRKTTLASRSNTLEKGVLAGYKYSQAREGRELRSGLIRCGAVIQSSIIGLQFPLTRLVLPRKSGTATWLRYFVTVLNVDDQLPGHLSL